MIVHLRAKALAQAFGKMARQRVRQIGILRHIGGQQFFVQRHLAVGKQHRNLGFGEPFLRRLPIGNDLVAW